MDEEIFRELGAVVGPAHVLIDAELRRSYERDVSGRYAGLATAVVRPADTDEVAATLRVCNARALPVIPQGGNTGLVGGGVPRDGGILLSLARLTRLEPVQRLTRRVVAGAGVTLAQLQSQAAAASLAVAIDFAARDSATLGGMAATDAGGQLALRYGTMRAQVAGLEAVLADGTVLDRLSGPLKDNAGYDLPQLILGSEGTLAVITALNMRLIRRPRHRVSILFGLAGLEQALSVLELLQEGLESIEAADFFEASGLELVLAHSRMPAPMAKTYAAYLIVDLASESDDLLGPLQEVLEGSELECEVAVAESSAERAALWAYRERHNEAVASAGVAHKLDVGVPLASVPRFASELRARIAQLAPRARVVLYGHLGDGNIHVNVLGGRDGASGAARAGASGAARAGATGRESEPDVLDRAVLELVAAYGGSISAEHGVGVAKAPYLGLIRSPGEIEAMRRIKLALDPRSILNPGVQFPLPAWRATRGPAS